MFVRSYTDVENIGNSFFIFNSIFATLCPKLSNAISTHIEIINSRRWKASSARSNAGIYENTRDCFLVFLFPALALSQQALVEKGFVELFFSGAAGIGGQSRLYGSEIGVGLKGFYCPALAWQ
ncbi:hypothetical protein DWB58_24320 [candidate division KSB1 bacterium]|nr:hypothetical protein [candidate division KSB1 bacterium]